jgi:peptidoglycan/LPS O-acetylase OafA/YrhL
LLTFDWVSRSWWPFIPFNFGWSGVALFFVISGYVIHRSFLLSKQFSWAQFFMRRFWRLYPAYLIFLLVFAYWHHVSIHSRDVLLHILLGHNVSQATFWGGTNPSFWSLAVEFQLYGMYPAAIMVHRRWGWQSMLGLSVAIAAGWIVIAYMTIGLSPDHQYIWLSPIALWPTWLIGAAIAEQHIQGRCLFKSHTTWIASMAILVLISFAVHPITPLQFYFAAIGWAAALDAYVYHGEKVNRFAKMLAFGGIVSYSTYLIHQPLIEPFLELLRMAKIVHPAIQIIIGTILFVPIVTLLGWVSYRIVERSSIRLGQQLTTRIVSWVGAIFRTRKVPKDSYPRPRPTSAR